MKNFNEYCREFIEKELLNMRGNKYYMRDLDLHITETIRRERTATHSTRLAEEYINRWWDEAGDYYEYENNFNKDFMCNPFKKPEIYMVRMIIAGVKSALSQCEIVDEYWNVEIELTDEVIETILDQIEYAAVEW